MLKPDSVVSVEVSRNPEQSRSGIPAWDVTVQITVYVESAGMAAAGVLESLNDLLER